MVFIVVLNVQLFIFQLTFGSFHTELPSLQKIHNTRWWTKEKKTAKDLSHLNKDCFSAAVRNAEGQHRATEQELLPTI